MLRIRSHVNAVVHVSQFKMASLGLKVIFNIVSEHPTSYIILLPSILLYRYVDFLSCQGKEMLRIYLDWYKLIGLLPICRNFGLTV